MQKNTAFSLVELLMALLVASLLMAALAPVMTRKTGDPEIKILADAADYDKDSVITIFTDTSETKEFNIPTDANRINVTMMGGGGAGGSALYGNREFTTSGTFTVPNDVHKIRVFMVGGGGSGASGGASGTVKISGGRDDGKTYQDFLTPGETSFTLTNRAKTIPALDAKCLAAGTKKWTANSTTDTTTQFSVGEIIPTKATACGGGGGGGGTDGSTHNSSGGGSGGYLQNISLNLPTSAVYVKIGGGGAGGGACYSGAHGNATLCAQQQLTGQCYAGGAGASEHCTTGTNGGSCNGITGGKGGNHSASGAGGAGSTASLGGTNNQGNIGGNGGLWAGGGGGGPSGAGGGGGGGGGPTTITTAAGTGGSILLQIGGGGGGGGGNPQGAGGAGGGGGGYGSGGGGGGGNGLGRNGYAPLSGSLNASIQTGRNGSNSGGGGGGGYNGAPGGAAGTADAGVISTIFGAEHCNGGVGSVARENSGGMGKPGALRLTYTYPPLKCRYVITPNGGAGGGAGQITVNEINVTPGETLYFEIGKGGNIQTDIASNGNSGGASHIRRGANTASPSIISAAGGYGGEFSSSVSSASQGGAFRNPNIGTNWTGIDYKSKVTAQAMGGDGYLATDGASPGYGGSGGASFAIKGNVLAGGGGGNHAKNGGTPNAINYGAGGGGGAGGLSDDEEYGRGGAGANGYIYIEWGGSNGSGGTAGEIVQGVLTNFDGSDRKMMINIGKGGSNSSGDGNGGVTALSVKSGGKNVVLTARGGMKGNIGTSDFGVHGDEVKFPDTYNVLYKKFVQSNLSIINGQKGIDEYGGMGGYLACIFNTKDNEGNNVCLQSIDANDGVEVTAGPVRPGCGGSAIPSPLYDAICNAKSTAASPDGGDGRFGGGGGGGAVLSGTSGLGGDGGDGFIILEYKSVQ